MTKDDNNRRKALRKEEPIFRQQSPALRIIGGAAAGKTNDFEAKSALRDLDLLVWDESERYFRRFAEDLDDAPFTIQDLLSETAEIGSHLGMEFTLSPLVLAFVKVRILAGGDEVYEKHYPLLCAIETSQRMNIRTRPLYDQYCKFLMLNKKDPATGEETLYRRGDPMERAKDTEEAKAETHIETLLGKILEATEGWNTKKAFGDYWEQWTELWAHLLKQEEMVEKISIFSPNSKTNHTDINIKLAFNVAGVLKRHLEKHLNRKDFTDTGLANLTKKAWSSISSHKEIGFPSELIPKQIDQINGWLAIHIK